MLTVSQKVRNGENSEEEKSAKFSKFFYVCPMVYPRQPNRKLNLNIKSSNTKIILIFKNLPVACVENQKSKMS